ncbi:MAG: RecX family transcriptional regulator, partial [Candidatus Marinimicrobia bacterium]|nr:RecX family transcriptional regulator [Candidatus Neomarinimicrobiota bacterium]
KPRTVFEVRKKLQKCEFEEIIIHSVLQELEDKNYVNDRDYAAEWIQTRSSSKPRSRRQLSFELRKKGISDDIIENDIIHALDDLDSALKLGRKYLNRYHQLDEKEFQKKMFGVLARRAFPFEIINKTIEKLLYERSKFD